MKFLTRTIQTGFKLVLVIFGVSVVTLGAFILIRSFTYGPIVEAASSSYYPNFCLGGWEYPQHASGPTSVSSQDDLSQFTKKNSAYLQSSVSSQIFCGYFSAKELKNPPTKVTVSFNWGMVFGTTTKPTDSYLNIDGAPISPETGFSPATTTATTSSPNVPATKNSAAVIDALPIQSITIPASSSTTPTARPSPTQATTTTQPSPTQATTTTQPSPTQATTTTQPSPTPASPQTDAPTPVSSAPVDTTPAPQSSTPTDSSPQSSDIEHSFMNKLGMFIVERAHAQEISTTTDVVESFSMTDFLDVSYSTDGIRWTSVGKVSKNNWKNFSVEIPVHSWAELKRLQVMVSTLPTIDEKPDIYLDSMSVHVDYKQTLSEIASNSLASVTTAVDSLLGNQSGDENFDPFAVKEDAPAEVKIVVPHVPATHTERKLLFSSRGEHTATQVVLPWYDDELKAKMKKQSSQSKDLTIQTTADESSFVVSGTCDHAYYVVLMFRNPKDYINKPNSFVSNSAFPCTNKSFTYDHKVISPEIPEGTYYMLVAGEDETGPWMPMSSIVPITINATTTTVTVE